MGVQSIGFSERVVLTCQHLLHFGMGSLNHSTVQDLCDANVAVERLKAEPFLGIKLPHIPFSPSALGHSSGCFLGKCCRGSQSRCFSWLVQTSPGLWKQYAFSFCFVESQVSLFEAKVFKYVGCRNSDHVLRLWQRLSGYADSSKN